MTLRDLSDAQIRALRDNCIDHSNTYFAARHTEKEPKPSFRAGFNAGMKAALSICSALELPRHGILPKSEDNKEEKCKCENRNAICFDAVQGTRVCMRCNKPV